MSAATPATANSTSSAAIATGGGNGSAPTDSSRHGSQSDLAHYCGPYKLDKTLGKGQTGKWCIHVCIQYHRHMCDIGGDGTLSGVTFMRTHSDWQPLAEMSII